MVIDVTGTFVVRARTGLSPEWDRGFDEEFAELISSDPDLVQAEFDALIGACWTEPPPVEPPASPATRPPPLPPPPDPAPSAARPPDEVPDQAGGRQRSPP